MTQKSKGLVQQVIQSQLFENSRTFFYLHIRKNTHGKYFISFLGKLIFCISAIFCISRKKLLQPVYMVELYFLFHTILLQLIQWPQKNTLLQKVLKIYLRKINTTQSFFLAIYILQWFNGKEFACQCRRHKRHEFYFQVGKIPSSKKQQPTPVFLPRKFHGQKNLADCSLRGCKELDTTERLSTHSRLFFK